MKGFKSTLILMIIFFTGKAHSQKMTIYTEDYPPFNMKEVNKIMGISTEIVKKMMGKAGFKEEHHYNIKFGLWKSIFKKAQKNKNEAVFSTTKTPDRVAKFKWVGPLVTNYWVMYSTKGSGIEKRVDGDNCDYLKKKGYVVRGYVKDATSNFLKANGWKLKLAPKDSKNVGLLAKDGDRKSPSLWATGLLLGPYLAKREGKPGMLEKICNISKKENHMYLAFSKKTPDTLIDKLSKALEELRQSGELEKIKSSMK